MERYLEFEIKETTTTKTLFDCLEGNREQEVLGHGLRKKNSSRHTKGNTSVRNKLVTPERKRRNSFVDKIEVDKKGRECVERREDSKNKT